MTMTNVEWTAFLRDWRSEVVDVVGPRIRESFGSRPCKIGPLPPVAYRPVAKAQPASPTPPARPRNRGRYTAYWALVEVRDTPPVINKGRAA